MAMDNCMQKGTTTDQRFKNDLVLAGWYQSWISIMIAKGILKIFSGTVPHDVMQDACCTSSKLDASYGLHTSEMVKSGIYEYNNSYDETVK